MLVHFRGFNSLGATGREQAKELPGLQPRSWLSVGATCDVTFFQGTKNHMVMTHTVILTLYCYTPSKVTRDTKKTYILQESLPVSCYSSFSFSESIQCPGRSTSVTSAKTTYKTQILWDVLDFSGLQAIKIQGHQRNTKSKSKANLPKFNGNLRGSTHPTFPKK